MDNRTVFILGAGFTKAFCPNAPLLEWDMTSLLIKLEQKYKEFPNICTVLQTYSRQLKSGSKVINIESLLSRLYADIPFDGVFLNQGERQILYKDIFANFLDVINKIKIDPIQKPILDQFARFVVDRSITCITFNYDTILDKALYENRMSGKTAFGGIVGSKTSWNPDGGYSFFCKPAESLIRESTYYMDDTSWLLKLHGSTNWRIKRGYQAPFPLEALVHEEDWYGIAFKKPEDMSIHREPNPFVIPPVLDKTALSEQPVLRVVWENAFKCLSKANKVIFLGYSLPKTDISSTFLFTDGMRLAIKKNIEIVNIDRTPKTKNKTYLEDKKRTYKELFDLDDKQFNFEGVSLWVKKNCVL